MYFITGADYGFFRRKSQVNKKKENYINERSLLRNKWRRDSYLKIEDSDHDIIICLHVITKYNCIYVGLKIFSDLKGLIFS